LPSKFTFLRGVVLLVLGVRAPWRSRRVKESLKLDGDTRFESLDIIESLSVIWKNEKRYETRFFVSFDEWTPKDVGITNQDFPIGGGRHQALSVMPYLCLNCGQINWTSIYMYFTRKEKRLAQWKWGNNWIRL
jgi:hypothetical protein